MMPCGCEILSRAAQTEIMPRFGIAGGLREKSSRFDIVIDADDAIIPSFRELRHPKYTGLSARAAEHLREQKGARVLARSGLWACGTPQVGTGRRYVDRRASARRKT
jgi:hypothetical protein